MNKNEREIETCEDLMNAINSSRYLRKLLADGEITVEFYDIPQLWIVADIYYPHGCMGGFNGNVARELFNVLPYETHTYFESEVHTGKVYMSIGKLNREVCEE